MTATTTQQALGERAGGVAERLSARPRRFLPPRLGRRYERRFALVAFLVPSLVYVGLFVAYPLYRDIVISFQNYGFSALAAGHGPFVGLANYRQMLNDGATIRAIANTVVFTLASVVAQFVIGFAMAVYLNRQFVGSAFLRRIILVPWVMPLVVTGTIFSLIFASTNGLANEVLHGIGLVHKPIGWLTSGDLAVLSIVVTNVWAGIPFNAILLFSGLQDVPPEQLEAASVDGASPWQRFTRVTVPMMRPVIMIVLMLGVVYTLKVFDIVIVLTNGGPANESQLMSSWAYTQAFSDFQLGTGTAVANILLVFSLLCGVVYILLSRGDNTGRARR
jgi:multiple sugar transport system permease protein